MHNYNALNGSYKPSLPQFSLGMANGYNAASWQCPSWYHGNAPSFNEIKFLQHGADELFESKFHQEK